MSAGEIRDYDFIRQFIPEGVPVFAADAGLYHLEKMNIEPSVVVGDFDSLIPGKEIHFPCVSFPPEKDDTDTILAVDLGLERGYRNFILLGASGGRLDHTFSNLSTLIYLREKGANGILIDNMNAAFLMCGGESYAPSEDDFLRQFGEIISVFTFGTETALVSEAGVKYPLERYSLSCAFPLGVSNKITDMEKCRISVHEGKILIIRVKNDTFSDISE
jgi:thiamine pyrophosphokinase